MNNQKYHTLVKLLSIPVSIFLIACLGAWVMNIVKIVHTCCQIIDGILVLRIVGIFVPPLGAVMGFIG